MNLDALTEARKQHMMLTGARSGNRFGRHLARVVSRRRKVCVDGRRCCRQRLPRSLRLLVLPLRQRQRRRLELLLLLLLLHWPQLSLGLLLRFLQDKQRQKENERRKEEKGIKMVHMPYLKWEPYGGDLPRLLSSGPTRRHGHCTAGLCPRLRHHRRQMRCDPVPAASAAAAASAATAAWPPCVVAGPLDAVAPQAAVAPANQHEEDDEKKKKKRRGVRD